LFEEIMLYPWGTLAAIAPYMAFSRKTCQILREAITWSFRRRSSGVKSAAEKHVWAGSWES
jgi:hypothetical protein